jgi:hypothetical protein
VLIRLTAVGVLALLSGCGVLRPGIPGSGVSHSELRAPGVFQEVALAGIGTVNVYPGESPSVRVTTDDNLMRHVETRVENGVLEIRPRRPIAPRTGLTVDVTVPHLTGAQVAGAGNLNLMGVSADSLDVSISGAGTLSGQGHVGQLTASISGVGEADLENLYADDARVEISGAGEASVYAIKSIDARISGIGDIVCYGNPDRVAQQISGIGELTLEESSGPVSLTIGDAEASPQRVR